MLVVAQASTYIPEPMAGQNVRKVEAAGGPWVLHAGQGILLHILQEVFQNLAEIAEGSPCYAAEM